MLFTWISKTISVTERCSSTCGILTCTLLAKTSCFLTLFLRAFCSQRVIWHLRVFTGHLTYLKYIKKVGYDFERRFIALFNNVLFFLECLEGFYGDQCNHQCKCKHGGICHHISGECKCIKPGWNGKFCEKG